MAAKDPKTTVKKGPVEKTVAPESTMLVNQYEIQLRSIDRTPKSIKTWRDAHIAAESIYSPNRSRLYDVYADVRLDGHLTGIINKRIDAVLNKLWHYQAKDGKKVDEMDGFISSSVFRQIMTLLLERRLWGVSGMEFIPGKDVTLREIPRKHIKPELGLIVNEQNGQTGIPYAEVPNVWVIGEERDLGLLLKCAPYAIYKKDNNADWAQYIGIFGQPVRVMKYNLHDREAKAALSKTLEESGSSLALMIPEGVDFDMKDGKQSNGDGKLQDTFKEALNAEMSVIILGNTETTTNGKTGSQAKSKEHGKQQIEVTKSDIADVANQLNCERFQAILRSYGLPVTEGGRFTTARELDLESLGERIGIDVQVAQQVPIDPDYWYETYNLTKPADFDQQMADKKAAAEQAPPPPAKGKKKDKAADGEDPEANLFGKLTRWQLVKALFRDAR